MNQRPAKKTRQDEPRGRSTERRDSGDRGNRRKGSPSPGRNLVVGWENRCFHCGSDKHTRKECAAFDKMMKDANVGKPKDQWKPPAGYKSALGKARDLQKAKNAGDKKKKISAFTHEEVMSEDSESEMSEAGFLINALRPLPKIRRKPIARPINAVNRFQGLDEQQEYDADVLASLNSWAHEVHVAPSRPKKSAVTDSKIDRTVNYINGPKKINDEPNNSVTESKQSQRAPVPTVNVDDDPTIVIQSEKDMKTHEAAVMKLMAALPKNPKKLQRAARRIGSIELEDDEILAMVDSGSFLHAINAEVDLPGHAIESIEGKDKARSAETACGAILKRLGIVRTAGLVDGETVNVKWNHMKVKTPILSVRQLVRDGHEVYINSTGGWIKNLENGKVIHFFEFQGVYYLKMKIAQPNPRPDTENEPLFSGRGA